MKSFKDLFTKYLQESPAAPEAPPKEKPDVKPDTEKPTTEPKSPPRRNPLEPRPGFQPRPKGLVPKGTQEEEEKEKINRNPDVKLFFKYRQNLSKA